MQQIDLPLTRMFVIRYTVENAQTVYSPSTADAKKWFDEQMASNPDASRIKLLGITELAFAEESRGSHEKLTEQIKTPRGKPAPPGGTPGTPVLPAQKAAPPGTPTAG